MALSDACFAFNVSIEQGESFTKATVELLDAIEWYGRPDCAIRYWPHQIEALRQAAKDVLTDSTDSMKKRWLRDLAECVRVFHDRPPPPDVIARAMNTISG